MGKKQRLKKENQKKEKQVQKKVAPSKAWVKWLVGVGVVLLALIVALVIVVKMNQNKLIKFSLVTVTQQVQQELNRKQARFTINDSETMQSILKDIAAMAANDSVDPVIGGNLNFMLNVLKEIIEQGNLRADELSKIKSLLADTKRRLEVNDLKKEK